MWHVGIDLHRETVVIAAVNDTGEVIKPVTVRCETPSIVNVVQALGSFRAVIEASATYRWLYDLLRPYATILLAIPFVSGLWYNNALNGQAGRPIVGESVADQPDSLAYIPPEPYQQLRELTARRHVWARVGRGEDPPAGLVGQAKSASPLSGPFRRPRLAWFRGQDFGWIENLVRDELLARLKHSDGKRRSSTAHRADVGGFSAGGGVDRDSRHRPLFGVVDRGGNRRGGAFPPGKQVGAYAGLTCGCISRADTVTAFDYPARVDVVAMDSRGGVIKAIRKDAALKNFYTRVRSDPARRSRGWRWPQTGGDLLEAPARGSTNTARSA